MQLRIYGDLQTFVSLDTFQQEHGLPDDFGVAHFQPKDWQGLGKIDHAQADMNRLRQYVLDAIPTQVAVTDWLAHLPMLAAAFESALHEANAHVGLKEQEIAFAVAGFGDVCSAYAFELVRAKMTASAPPDFSRLYAEWLYGTVGVGGTIYDYVHHGQTWRVRVITHAYGRVGLMIETPSAVYYVADKGLACPAESFMQSMLQAVAQHMMDNTLA